MSIRFSAICVAVACIFESAGPASANFDEARRYYESLALDDQIAITLGLIATGDFVSLHQLGFNKRYYNSIVSFEEREGLRADGMLKRNEMAVLSNKADSFVAGFGMRNYVHPVARSKLLVPHALFDTETSGARGYEFKRNDGNLALSFVAYPSHEESFYKLFETLSHENAQRTVVYKKMQKTYFVVTGEFHGRPFYTWMSLVPGGSTGFTLSWSPTWRTTGSKLSILLANAFVPVSSDEPSVSSEPPVTAPPPQQTAENPPGEPPAEPSSSSGTGFRVSEAGHVMTNFHVVGKCKALIIHRSGDLPVDARLVAGDEINDLALVKAIHPLSGTVAKLAGKTPKVGTDIAVFGFPLTTILADSGNFVTGNITSLAGIGNDSRVFQISAPVQPGNSGGPVVDSSGAVVAIVVSKLNALVSARSTGDIPQNVNFAIKSNVAMNFLDGNNVDYETEPQGPKLDLPMLAEHVKSFTYLIECRN